MSSSVGSQRTRTVLSLLKDEGFVVEAEGGLFSIPTPPPDPQAINDKARQYEARRIADRHRLDALLAYVKAPGCRNKVILEYLGEDQAPNCGRCDNCLRSREAATAAATQASRLGAAMTRALDEEGGAELADIKPAKVIRHRVVRIDAPAAVPVVAATEAEAIAAPAAAALPTKTGPIVLRRGAAVTQAPPLPAAPAPTPTPTPTPRSWCLRASGNPSRPSNAVAT